LSESIPVLLDSINPVFPDPNLALRDPDGLLAIGGNLSSRTLLCAYSQGIFPWYEDDQPLLWWSPDPRAVIVPDELHVSRSLKKSIRNQLWKVTTNQAFDAVIQSCAQPREYSQGTWITEAMIQAYCQLHEEGHAHSIEVWLHEELVGGLYGLLIGRVFCGESMFSRTTNASKIAMHTLCSTADTIGLSLIDCQLPNPHLLSLGAKVLSRTAFLQQLSALSTQTCHWPNSTDYITV
jgi:leucyl/phenylalanyl-tRNA--protein transferase